MDDVALITGAAGDIGAATARRLADRDQGLLLPPSLREWLPASSRG